jgi:hypothetical protein
VCVPKKGNENRTSTAGGEGPLMHGTCTKQLMLDMCTNQLVLGCAALAPGPTPLLVMMGGAPVASAASNAAAKVTTFDNTYTYNSVKTG